MKTLITTADKTICTTLTWALVVSCKTPLGQKPTSVREKPSLTLVTREIRDRKEDFIQRTGTLEAGLDSPVLYVVRSLPFQSNQNVTTTSAGENFVNFFVHSEENGATQRNPRHPRHHSCEQTEKNHSTEIIGILIAANSDQFGHEAEPESYEYFDSPLNSSLSEDD